MIWPSLAHGKFQVVCSPLPLKKRDRNPAEKDISDVALWFFRRRWFLQFDLWYFRTFVWLSPTGTSPWVNVQCWNRQGPSFFSFRLSWEAFLSWSLEPLWVRLCGTLIDLFGGHPKDWQRSNAVQGHFCETKKHAERILQFMSLWVYDSWDFCNSLSLFDTHTQNYVCALAIQGNISLWWFNISWICSAWGFLPKLFTQPFSFRLTSKVLNPFWISPCWDFWPWAFSAEAMHRCKWMVVEPRVLV